MSEYRKLDLEVKDPSFLVPPVFWTDIYPSVTPLRTSFSGAVYFYGKGTTLVTSNGVSSESLTLIIELKNSEVDEIFKDQSLLAELLKEEGIQEQEIEKMNQALLEYVETTAQMKHLELPDDVKKALSNLMVLVAKKLSEET